MIILHCGCFEVCNLISLYVCSQFFSDFEDELYPFSKQSLQRYRAYNMTKRFEFELCEFELLTSVI